MKPYRRVILAVIVTMVIVIGAEVCLALAVMWSGAVYIGADRPHPRPIRWYLDHAMTYSVQEHARGLTPPAQAQVSIAAGATYYDRMCALCHGAPGVERSAIGQGLSPDPPHLTQTATDWTVEQVYWLITHGVGDTGMPAFGPTYAEQQRWAAAYLVKQLPRLTPTEYHRLVAEGTAREPSDEHGESRGPQP
jgi:mono/diheme cytochrome c family protein